MKTMFRIFSLAVFALIASQSFSQFMITGQGSYLKLLGGSDIKNFGFGGKLEYGINEKTVPYLGVNYYLPYKYSGMVEGSAFSSATSPQHIEVEAEHSISFTQITLGAKRYLGGSTESTVGFYILAELGYLLAPYKVTIVDDYDENMYEVFSNTGKETLQNFIIDFGLGLDGNLSFGTIFIETKLCLPANKVNDQYVSIDIPASWCTNAGVRFTLGDSGRGYHSKRRRW